VATENRIRMTLEFLIMSTLVEAAGVEPAECTGVLVRPVFVYALGPWWAFH